MNKTAEHTNTVKYTVKDSVFHNLFASSEYLFQLYQTLHPEDRETVESDLTIATIQRIVTTGEYNDLGFLVKDKFIILVEAQSTWSVNIIIRSMMYLMSSYKDYLDRNDIDIHSTKKLELPKPELYVLYTKDRNGHPDTISFREKYFPNEDCCIDAKVKIIYEDESGSITSQYIGFCKVLDDCVKKYGRTQKAIEETFRICYDKNLLTEYLKTRETEVRDIMFTLFDQERATELHNMEIARESEARGREKGIIDTYLLLARDNIISKDVAAKKLGISVSEFEEKMQANA